MKVNVGNLSVINHQNLKTKNEICEFSMQMFNFPVSLYLLNIYLLHIKYIEEQYS